MRAHRGRAGSPHRMQARRRRGRRSEQHRYPHRVVWPARGSCGTKRCPPPTRVFRAERRPSQRSRPCRNAMVRHPARGRTRFRPGEAPRGARGHEGTGRSNAARFFDGLRIVNAVPDGIQDVSQGRAEAVAEAAGQSDGRSCRSGSVCIRGSRAQRDAPARRLACPFVEDRRVWVSVAHCASRADAREGQRPRSCRRHSRTQARRDLGDQEGELTRRRRTYGATAVPRPVVVARETAESAPPGPIGRIA